MAPEGTSTKIQHWGTALQIWGCRCSNSVCTSASPAPPVLDFCSSFMFPSQLWFPVRLCRIHQPSRWRGSKQGGVWRAQLQEHLQKQLLVLEWAQRRNEQPLGRAAWAQPQTHNYGTAMTALGYVSQSTPMRATKQSHQHEKGWISKWKSAEFTAAELCTSQQPLCAA